MSIYEVVGYENRNGISKKSGKPYDMDIIHVIDTEPLSGDGCCGNRVESITYNRLVNGPLKAVPAVGRKIKVIYNRSGFVADIEPVEV